jgi:hypothetical protein
LRTVFEPFLLQIESGTLPLEEDDEEEEDERDVKKEEESEV